MTLSTFIQIFLFINVFFIGVLAATALRHANAHYRPPVEPEHEQPHPTVASITLPADVKERLAQASQVEFQTAISHSADRLLQDLGTTSEEINNLIKRLATDIVSDELVHYRDELAQIHKRVEADMGAVKQEMVGHEAELKAKLAQEMELEKKRLLQQIDTKLADAVGSFLLETLGHNVDLGSQSSYLTAMLEQHKADFIKEVGNENPTT
jgi:hypothetical protein